MNVTIGLDIGGSTTKVVGFRNGVLLDETFVKSSDPIAAAYGGIGKFLNENLLKLKDIEKIRMTGVGSSYVNGKFFDKETSISNEFEAVGLGGLYVSKLNEAVVVSIGTGTSMVYSDGKKTEHIIGSGVGGGTLLGLADKMIKYRDFELISKLASTGDLTKVDLTVHDISKDVPGLSGDATASNFGKINDDAKNEDLAKGIINMVFQSIGTSAVLAAKLKRTNNIVFVGSVIDIEQGRETLAQFADMYKMNILMPENAKYATAIGAALSANTIEI